MVKIREKQTEQLEKAASKGLKLGGWKKMTLSSKIAAVVLVLVALTAILAPLLAPYSPVEIFTARQAPGNGFIFGTDDKGRDILSRMLYGGRYSLIIGFGATAMALVCGSVVGALAAVSRKSVSEAIMRILDIIMSIPGIALAAVFVSILGNSVPSIIFAIGFMYTPQIARIVRANIVSEYGEDYVRAVIVSGAKLRDFDQARPAQLHRPDHGFHRYPGRRRHHLRGLADLHRRWYPGAHRYLGQHPRRRSRWRARWPLVAGAVPGPGHHDHLPGTQHPLRGITDAMAAAPSAALDPTDSSKRREADLLVSDPVRAYKEQAQSLSARLGALRDVELKRNDRHVPDESVEPILSVRDFCIQFEHHGDINVVDHVNFDVRPGQTMGLVGESGCGKSITTLAIMGLTDDDEHLSGEVLWEGRDLLKMSKKEWFGLRGTDIAMVYQDALSSLNPSMLISAQMKQLTKRGGTRSAEELLELVGLDPKRTLESYPHELSGGQRQRVLIAMALTRDPKLVICDEPTTALDVTVQKQVIKLLNDLQAKLGFAMIFVSHDLALVAEVAHNITVMYAGQVIEQAPTKELLTNRFTSTPAAFWVPSCPSRAVRAACTRCPAPFRARAISPRAIASRPARAIRALAWTPVRSSSACPAPSTSIPSSPMRCSRQMV